MGWISFLRQLFEATLTYIASLTIPLFPRKGLVVLADCLGACGFRFCRRMRRIAIANVSLALGASVSSERAADIVRRAFQSFALVVLDVFWFSFRSRKRVARYVRIDSSLDPYFEHDRIIAVTAHLGNWEIMGQAVALRGFPCVSVAAPLENRFVDRIVNRLRERTGQQIASKQGAVRALVKELKSGGRVAVVMDQNLSPRKGGEFVEFFGLPVPVSTAAGVLSVRMKAPALVCYCVREKDGYIIGARPLLEYPSDTEDYGGLVQKIMRDIETLIRQYPEQWLWMYKRWKYIPDGADSTRYPFYAIRK